MQLVRITLNLFGTPEGRMHHMCITAKETRYGRLGCARARGPRVQKERGARPRERPCARALASALCVGLGLCIGLKFRLRLERNPKVRPKLRRVCFYKSIDSCS